MHGVPRRNHRLLHIIINAVEHRALVDDEGLEVPEEGAEVVEVPGEVGDVLGALVDPGVRVVELRALGVGEARVPGGRVGGGGGGVGGRRGEVVAREAASPRFHPLQA